MTVDGFDDAVRTRLPDERARTMAGLVCTVLGRRPHPGDTVDVNDVRLSVDDVDALRITRLRVSLTHARAAAPRSGTPRRPKP